MEQIIVEQKKITLDDRILDELENFHKDSNSIYNEKNERLKSAFNIIAIKDNDDLLKAHQLFGELNIIVVRSLDDKFLDGLRIKPIDNEFLIKDSDGWRIQSHYIGFGMNVEDLEKCVNYIKNKGVNTKTEEVKDYTKDRIISRIKDLEEGKKAYDVNSKIVIGDGTVIKQTYTEEAIKFWENSELIITELKRFI